MKIVYFKNQINSKKNLITKNILATETHQKLMGNFKIKVSNH